MQEINNTQYFNVQKDMDFEVKDVIARIYEALTEKGYNPVNQIVGYVMSGDPLKCFWRIIFRIISNNSRQIIGKGIPVFSQSDEGRGMEEKQ